MFEDLFSFHEFVREERMFCATLAHLLMQSDPRGRSTNLERFLGLVNSRLDQGAGSGDPLDASAATTAQLYLEFTFLRDHWNRIHGTKTERNLKRRNLICSLLRSVPGLEAYGEEADSLCPPDSVDPLVFNRYFMETAGGTSPAVNGIRVPERDVAYPVLWSIPALRGRWARIHGNGARDSLEARAEFRRLCQFKWAFNAKPDLVVLLPDARFGARAMCIEAKLESGEDSYVVDYDQGRMDQGRVGQIELQQFMFRYLLNVPFQSVLVSRAAGIVATPSAVQGDQLLDRTVKLSWSETFASLCKCGSIGFTRTLLEKNGNLKPRLVELQ